MLIPLLIEQCEAGLKAGKSPTEILEIFFTKYCEIPDEKSRLDFMFKIIQYVERQVVLYDSVEDSAFPKLQEYTDSLSIKDYFEVVEQNKNWDKIADKLASFSARIVLTAHPTQFYTSSVLDIIDELRSLIDDNKVNEIDMTLQQLGLTSLVNSKKPTPLNEARNIIYILRKTYYHAIGELFQYMNLMKCYYNDLKGISKKLTFVGLQDDLEALRTSLYNAMFNSESLVSYDEIISKLSTIRTSLVEDYHGLYLDVLDEFIDKVHIFKTVDWLLNKEVNIDVNVIEDPVVRDTIVNIKQLKSLQDRNGEEGINRYIISNSEDVFSVLFVFGLFRWCGISGGDLTFDIVPLFETMKGMADAGAIMKKLYALEDVRKHVGRRGDKQTMMLGFSDGTKDGGYLKANWSILKTKEILSKVCQEHGVKAVFFDGRGGPPARGGGKTHRFYAAQTKDVANHEIQLTIQGQTITSTYGTREQFIHNAEQLLTAGLSNNLFGKSHSISEAHRSLIEELSNLSFAKYDALKKHDKFIPYLEQRSTLKYYTMANIGSRPSKRGKSKQLTLSDLRAISFVGSWSQLKQNVPGYFGLGTAIQTLVEQGRLEEMQELFNEVPFFKALMKNSMMSLAKTNFNLTRYMKNDPEFGEFWQILYDECQLSIKMLKEISGHQVLMENELVSKESIAIRERIVLPLLVIQQNALFHLNKESEFTELYQKIVTRSLYGNINASRNSA